MCGLLNPILHSERPKLHTILAFLGAIGLREYEQGKINVNEKASDKPTHLYVPVQCLFSINRTCPNPKPVLQIRRGKRDNLEIISHNTSLNHMLQPIIRTSRQDGSNKGSQYVFIEK